MNKSKASNQAKKVYVVLVHEICGYDNDVSVKLVTTDKKKAKKEFSRIRSNARMEAKLNDFVIGTDNKKDFFEAYENGYAVKDMIKVWIDEKNLKD